MLASSARNLHRVHLALYRIAETTHKAFTVRYVPVVSMATHHWGRQTVAAHVLVHLALRLTHLPRVAECFQEIATYAFAVKVMRDVPANGEPSLLYTAQ